jgi:hypothetical protein
MNAPVVVQSPFWLRVDELDLRVIFLDCCARSRLLVNYDCRVCKTAGMFMTN